MWEIKHALSCLAVCMSLPRLRDSVTWLYTPMNNDLPPLNPGEWTQGSGETNNQTDPAHHQGLFAFALFGMPHLNLTNLVRMEQYMSAAGGYSDIMKGYASSECLPCDPMRIENGEVKVAIKRFRASLHKKEKYAKVWPVTSYAIK